MTDQDLNTLYSRNYGVSHAAALRAIFDAGYQAGTAQPITAQTADASLNQTLPASDVTITTV